MRTGAKIELRAPSTILTTGGFSANKDLLKKHIGPHADQCKLRGSKQDTGDGLRMALEIGAKAVNMKYFYGHLISRKALVDDRFWPYPRLDGFVDEGILVNREGMQWLGFGNSPLWRSLRHRNYRLYLAGQLISVCGTWMQQVAQSWLIYRLTGSATLLGVVGFATQIPVFVLGAIGGVVSDRYSAHRVAVWTQTAALTQAVLLAGLTLSGWVQPVHIILLGAVLGVVNAFDMLRLGTRAFQKKSNPGLFPPELNGVFVTFYDQCREAFGLEVARGQTLWPASECRSDVLFTWTVSQHLDTLQRSMLERIV